MQEKHKLEFNGQSVHVYKRPRSRFWQCSTCINSVNHRATTKEANLAVAKSFAEEWYLRLRLELLASAKGQVLDLAIKPRHPDAPADKRLRVVRTGPTFKEACDVFLREYPILTGGERNEAYAKSHGTRINTFLLPFFGADTPVASITEADVVRYREHRMSGGVRGKHANKDKLPSRTTINHDIVTLRMVFKTAKRHAMIGAVPDMSEPYKKSKKVRPRPWFSPDEYKQLYEATRRRAENPPKADHKEDCEDLHDTVLFAANTGLRPDEIFRLQFRDVGIDTKDMDGKAILHIRVSDGKMGYGLCKSTPGAVEPFRRLLARRGGKPTDLVFPVNHREMLNAVLIEEGLKKSRDGGSRSLYSLRHTYICLRLIEGAEAWAVAKNCRTSVEIIESHYASHIAALIDAQALNVRRSPPKGPPRGGAKGKQNKGAKRAA